MLGVRIPPGLPFFPSVFSKRDAATMWRETKDGLSVTTGDHVQNVKTFLESVKIELGKVTWPSRKETVATTGVVVVIILLISIYLGACDIVLAKLMRLILG